MFRRIHLTFFIALTLLLLTALPAYASYAKIYTDSEFASEVKNTSADAEWGIISYTEPSAGKATVKLALQTKTDKKEEQPVLLQLWLLTSENISLSGSAYIQAVDSSTYLPKDQNLMTLNFSNLYDDDVPAGSTDWWLAGNTLSKNMHAYSILVMSLTDEMASIGQGRWVITIEMSGITDEKNFDANFGIPWIAYEVPGSYALTAVNNTTTGYTVGTRWLYLPDTEVTENYIVSLEVNGGNTSYSPLTVKKGENVNLPEPAKTGSKFSGWYSDKELKNKVTSPYTPTSDITLYAGWTEDTPAVENWTISFNSNGGSAVNPITVIKGQSASLPNPTMTGYTFKGWYNDSALQNKVSSPYTPSSDITLYAGWTENAPVSDKWTITFVPNGGNLVSPISVVKGQSASLPIPSLTGASFDGWFTDITLRNRVTNPYTPSSDITLYAGWTVSNQDSNSKWTVTFNSNGGSTVNSISVLKGDSISLPTPSLNAYTFNGWHTDSTLLNRVSSPFTPSSNITLYAGWTKSAANNNAGTIPSGGSQTSSENKVDSSTSSTTNGTTSNTNTNSDSGSTSGSDSASTSNSDGNNSNVNDNANANTNTNNNTVNINYNTGESGNTAAQTTYTVSYNTNGGNEIGSSVVLAGNSVTLPTPAKSGYTFAGWYSDANLSAKIGSSTYTPTSDITLYAKWTANISTSNSGAVNSVPKTGISSNITIVIFVMIALIASAAVIIYIRYRKISKSK